MRAVTLATAIGMRREWYQSPAGPMRASFPHYDVSLSRRKVAVKLGAVEVDRYAGHKIRKAIRARIIADQEFA